MQYCVTDQEADTLLRSLPSLRQLRLRVEKGLGNIGDWEPYGPEPVWEPQPPLGLTSLHLVFKQCPVDMDPDEEGDYGSPHGTLDLSAVAALPALHELCLRLDVDSLLVGVAALAQLEQLTRLEINVVASVDDDYWQVISQLPSLQQAGVPWLDLPVAGEQEQDGSATAAIPRLTSLTSLRTDQLFVGDSQVGAGPPAQPAFSLAQALPQLQHLQMWYTHIQRVESWQALLQGHPQLSSLELTLPKEPDAQVSQQLAALLQALPRLTRLRLDNRSSGTDVWAAGGLLAAATQAGLPGLRKLDLRGQFPVAPLALPGACAGLQQLELRRTDAGPAALAALLGGGMPHLRSVRLVGETPHRLMQRDRELLYQLAHLDPSETDAALLLRLARAIADSGELMQALADAATQQLLRAAAAPPERPGTRAAAAAARAAEQELEARCEPALRHLAARLQRGAEGQPLLPQQEAAALLQRVRQQLVLRERLAQQLEGSSLERLQLQHRGCSIEISC